MSLLSYSRAPAAASCTAHILDGNIDKIVRQIFERMKSVPKSEIVNARCRQKMEERKQLLQSARAEHAKAVAELDFLFNAIADLLKELLISGILSNLSGMFDSVNEKVGDITTQVGLTPQA